MSFDRWFAIFSLLLSLFLGWLLYRRQIRPKRLAVTSSTPLPLMIPVDDVTVTYAGKERQELVRVYVLLWNRGSAPIEEADFIKPIELVADPDIVDMKILDKDSMANIDVHNQSQSISIKLLRPGEACIVQIDAAAETYRPNLSVQMKAPDMSTQISARRARYPEYIGNLAAAPLFLLAPFTPIFVLSKLESGSLPNTLGADLFFGSMAILLVGALGISWLTKRLAEKLLLDAISPVAARFFRSDTLISSASTSWRSMRSEIAALFNR